VAGPGSQTGAWSGINILVLRSNILKLRLAIKLHKIKHSKNFTFQDSQGPYRICLYPPASGIPLFVEPTKLITCTSVLKTEKTGDSISTFRSAGNYKPAIFTIEKSRNQFNSSKPICKPSHKTSSEKRKKRKFKRKESLTTPGCPTI